MGRQHLSAKLLWKPSGDFTDSESDDFEEPGGRCFRVCWEMLHTLGGSGGGKVPGSPLSHSGLALLSLISSLAALTSSSSSAACSVQYSRPSHRLPPSSTWGSCRIQVRPLPLAVFRVRLSPIGLGSRSNLSCRGELLRAVVPVFTGLCPRRRDLW